MEKIGFVDVGGGLRGIYGAGILDYLMSQNYYCDYCIGVSAGSANGMAYIAKQPKRNYQFYNVYSSRKEYMGLHQLIKKGSYLDLDYIYGELTNDDGEYPVDYDTFMKNPTDFEIVATEAVTGTPVYFEKKDTERNNYSFMKCSCCVPGIDQPYPFQGKNYYDGGMSDPIPYQRAFEKGCTKVVVILTRPRNYFRKRRKDQLISELIPKKYMGSRKAIQNRALLYNKQLKEILQLEEEGKVLILAPDSIKGLGTLSKNHEALDLLYYKGYYDGQKVLPFIGRKR